MIIKYKCVMFLLVYLSVYSYCWVKFADEVESLAAARKSALSGSEPSDSIRVFSSYFYIQYLSTANSTIHHSYKKIHALCKALTSHRMTF